MMFQWILPLGAVLLLAASGAAFAQQDDASFYAEPVWPNPVLDTAHILAPSVATADVALVTATGGATTKISAKTPRHAANCDAFNPCAIASPAG